MRVGVPKEIKNREWSADPDSVRSSATVTRWWSKPLPVTWLVPPIRTTWTRRQILATAAEKPRPPR